MKYKRNMELEDFREMDYHYLRIKAIEPISEYAIHEGYSDEVYFGS